MKLIVTCGGTGGHITPGLAIADLVTANLPGSRVLFIGGCGMERRRVPDAGYAIKTLELSGVRNKYIVDLLGEKRDKVIRSFIVEADGPLLFPYLKAGKYCIRITEDLNRNNIVDTGNLLEHRQPEKVRFFKVDDQFLIQVLERSEMVWTLDLEEMFR